MSLNVDRLILSQIKCTPETANFGTRFKQPLNFPKVVALYRFECNTKIFYIQPCSRSRALADTSTQCTFVLTMESTSACIQLLYS